MEHKKLMLNGGDLWWENRQLPMNIFLYHRIQDLQYTLGTFMLKNRYYLGPVTSMQNILKKGNKKYQLGQKERTKPYQPKDSIGSE